MPKIQRKRTSAARGTKRTTSATPGRPRRPRRPHNDQERDDGPHQEAPEIPELLARSQGNVPVPEIISDLKITQESATKVEGETFLVLCRDANGRSVTWKDSRGQPLGMKTRPTILSASYGTAIVFNGTRQEDQGVYTCSNGLPEQDKQFSLTVEGQENIKPTRPRGRNKSRPNKERVKDKGQIDRGGKVRTNDHKANNNINHEDRDESDGETGDEYENKTDDADTETNGNDDNDLNNNSQGWDKVDDDSGGYDENDASNDDDVNEETENEQIDDQLDNDDDDQENEDDVQKKDTDDDAGTNDDDDNNNYKEDYNEENEDFNNDDDDEDEDTTPLTFMDTATQQVGIEGRDVTLRCEVKGGQVTWLFDNGDIILSSAFPRYKVIGDGLLIEKVNRTDTRTYVCKAVQTSTGTMQDKKIRLTVRHKPSLPYAVYAKQEQAWAYINGTVNLTCEVEAEPPPQFEWFKKHKKINVVHGRVLNISNHISILQMIVDKKTFGDYKCVAKNELGKLEKYYSLEPGTKPYPPEFIEQRGANHDLLDIGIHPPNPPEEMPKGMEPIGFNVEYKKMEEVEWGSHDFNITDDNSYPIRNLEQDTEYEIRAATRNVAGLSDYTNISVFKTLKSEGSGIHSRDINGLVFSLGVVISACFTSW